MKITFIRHAQTEYNKKGLLQGQIDCDLSKEEREELRKFANTFYKEYTVCYCSPLKRARETAQAILHGRTDDSADILIVTHTGIFYEAKPMFGLRDDNKSKNLETCTSTITIKDKTNRRG